MLEPLAEWAERLDVAVLAISHPPKAAQAKAIHAVTGSLAFVAAARMVFLAIAEPEADRSLLLPVKNNLGPKVKGLGYRIVSREIGDGISIPFVTSSSVEWDSEPVNVTADEVVRAREGGTKANALSDAETFLRNELGFGGRPASEIRAKAEAEGISTRTLARAKASLGISARKEGFGGEGVWVWSLPQDEEEALI